MELVQTKPHADLLGVEMGATRESVARFLDSQRELFHGQVEHLRRIVLTQCKLTGANPLSQEMAAGALSIKIGKRPRDLINPKAIKYMQSVFSIKDTIGKKETREISALCGATLTQVREYFAGQRSRVRKFVRLAREKAIRSDTCNVSSSGPDSEPNLSVSVTKEISVDFDQNKVAQEGVSVQLIQHNLNAVPEEKHASTVVSNGKIAEGGPSCLPREENIPAISSDDSNFLENIFCLMRKEETFAGQVQLMEWILQINNSTILYWFLAKNGINILATWLSQAALEEQTTVINAIFKVLCHLPLHKALPLQISTILQTVNKLRFYRSADISNKARFLLSRWSKLFVRSQAGKKSPFMNMSDEQKEMFRKRRISEILSDESWRSKVNIPDDILAIGEGASEMNRPLYGKGAVKLLQASCDNSDKKHDRTAAAAKTKERRKVLLMEQPDQNGRTVPTPRTVPPNVSRPISADDIQKAKIRAIHMQNKYGKIDLNANEKNSENINDQEIPSVSQSNNVMPVSISQANSFLPASNSVKVKEDQDFNSVVPTKMPIQSVVGIATDLKPTSNQPMLNKLRSDQVSWQKPPEIRMNLTWGVCCGESSKEVDVQTQRNRREKETFYPNVHDVPPNPKEPWDVEMDFDDSLTPEIPTEQPPEVDAADGSVVAEDASCSAVSAADVQVLPAPAPVPPVSNVPTEPDLELLAVLLKNPELVFALTSDQAGSMTDVQKVALLDMLKSTGASLNGLLNGREGDSASHPEPTSLPSPTPSEARTGWRRDTITDIKNHPLQHQPSESRDATPMVASPLPPPPPLPPLSTQGMVSSLVLTQTPKMVLTNSQLVVSVNQPIQQAGTPLLHLLPKSDHHFIPTKPLEDPVIFEQNRHQNPRSHPIHPTLPRLPPAPPLPPTALTLDSPHFSPHPRERPLATTRRGSQITDSWGGRHENVREAAAPVTVSGYQRITTNQNHYNGLPSGPVHQQPAYGRAMLGREAPQEDSFENWSPSRSPDIRSNFRSNPNFTESRWNRFDQSRDDNPGYRNHQSSHGRWRRDREHDRNRGRRF